MSSKGLILRAEDKVAKSRAHRYGLGYCVLQGWELPFDRALVVGPGATIPYDLLEAGFSFLDQWDAAAPLWRYGINADAIGLPEDRKRTEALALDLRIPVYAPELLFIRKGGQGQALYAAWAEECGGAGDPRLAFLRALCRVKPCFLALPRTWLAEIAQRTERDRRAAMLAQSMGGGRPIVKVQVGPGRWVKCYAGEEERVRRQYQEQTLSRVQRRAKK